MARLVPAIHVFLCGAPDVDARHKAGHDEGKFGKIRQKITLAAAVMVFPIAESEFIVPLNAAGEAQCERIGPKAANLAALARAGLPTPGGFCLAAEAYRAQIAVLGLEDLVRRFAAADMIGARRSSVATRLALYDRPLAPAILPPLLDAWHAQREETTAPSAVLSS